MNKVEELATIVALVKDELSSKERALVDADAFNAYSMGRVKNVLKRIEALELSATEIKERFSDKPDVFVNFRKRASEIMNEIKELR